MKALVLAAGRGKRMEELSSDTNKCLISLKGKPLIEYSLDAALSIDAIDEIVVTVGYQAEAIINRYGIDYHGKRVRYTIQVERKGLVHAIECARPHLAGADFQLFLGDEVILGGRHAEMIQKFEEEKLFAVCGVVRAKNRDEIKKTYAILGDGTDRVIRLIEKPEKPVNDIQGTGNCLFRNAIFDYVEKVPINQKRGEKELPDLIQCAIDAGELVKSYSLTDYYINVNTPEELARVEAFWPEAGAPAPP